jgi:hypothetical protein
MKDEFIDAVKISQKALSADQSVVVGAFCSHTRRSFGIVFLPFADGGWICRETIGTIETPAKTDHQADAGIELSTPLHTAYDYAGCPHCKNLGFMHCNTCGTVSCLGETRVWDSDVENLCVGCGGWFVVAGSIDKLSGRQQAALKTLDSAKLLPSRLSVRITD